MSSEQVIVQTTLDTSTPEAILQAALEVLHRDGFQRLTVRAIAEAAGVNHALINYHYGAKQKLLLAMLARLESGKYARQWEMYDEPDVPLSKKWRRAVRFYRDDLDDGYQRVLYELRIAGRRNPEIAEHVARRMQRWNAMLLRAATEMLPPLGIHLPPEYVVTALWNFWNGMDERIIDGGPETEEQCFKVLEFVGDWLEERERACIGSGDRATV